MKSCNSELEERVTVLEELFGMQSCKITELFRRTDHLKAMIDGQGIGPFSMTFIADQGEAGAKQTAVANRVIAENADISLFGGDNNYETGSQLTVDNNWAAFQPLIDTGRAIPAYGNHDLDSGLQVQYDKFPYLPGNRRYFHQYFPEGMTDLFVLNSGINSGGMLVEPDGNYVGSAQYNWFHNAIKASCGLFKIVMFHHPFISGVSDGVNSGRVYTVMDWDFKSLGVDLVLNGHTHTDQHIVHDGSLNVIDVSSSVRIPRIMSNSGSLYGSKKSSSYLVWSYAAPGSTGVAHYSKISIIGKVMLVEFKRVDTGSVVYSFTISK